MVVADEGTSCQSANGGVVNINYCQWTDNELVAAMIQKSSEAYGELFQRHISTVIAASRVILRYGPDSEDVATEVFVRFWISPENFDPSRCSVVGFLRMSAKRRSIDFIRSSSARTRREAIGLYDVTVPPHDSDARLIASEEDDLVKQSIKALPEFEREVIENAFYNGMTYSAVAVHLGLPEGTVKTRIRNGLRRLQMNDELRLVHNQSRTDGGQPDVTLKTSTNVDPT
jgi:RNA polymerase sigma-70 factor (ECF subfamily)